MDGNLTQEMQLILNALANGVFGTDAEGTVTFCNEALLHLTGYSREEVVGKNAHDVLHHCRPDGTKCPREECAFQAAIKGSEPTQVVVGPLSKKDGSSVPVEYCGRPLQQPVEHTSYVAIIRD